MRISEADLAAFPPSKELIQLVENAAGLKCCGLAQKEAFQELAELLYPHFQRLVHLRRRMYKNIGTSHEMKDDIQRLCAYVFFGLREDSKGHLNENQSPLITWLEKLKSPQDARSLKIYLLFVANRYLRRDLHRNRKRGWGREIPVHWNEERPGGKVPQDGLSDQEPGVMFSAMMFIDSESLSEENTLVLRDLIRKCLDVLPHDEKEALLSKFYYGMTQGEHALEKGVSPATMNRRIERGLQKFEELLRAADPHLLKKSERSELEEPQVAKGVLKCHSRRRKN